MSNTSILVIGAGDLGLAILKNLVLCAKGRKITVLLRSGTIASKEAKKLETLNTLRGLKVDILAGDVVENTEAELSVIFSPFHTIIHASGVAAGFASTDSLLKVTRAVIAAKTPRFFPWQFGFDFDAIGPINPAPLGAEQFELRTLLRSQTTTDWVILSVGVFMDVFFMPEFGVIDPSTDTMRGLGSWDTSITLSDVKDVGLLTAKVVMAEPEFKNEILFAAGETTTYSELAETIEKVHGRPMKRELLTLDVLKESISSNPDDKLARWRLLFAQGKGVAWDDKATVNRKMGIKMAGVEEFARNL